MKKEYSIRKVKGVWICEVKMRVTKVRRFWFNTTETIFKPLNVLGTVLVVPNKNRFVKRKITTLKCFQFKKDAEVWLSKIKKRVENRI